MQQMHHKNGRGIFEEISGQNAMTTIPTPRHSQVEFAGNAHADRYLVLPATLLNKR